MSVWRFVAARVAPNSTVLVGELTEVHSRQVTWRLVDACAASFTLDGRHELATLVEELTIDLLVYRDDALVFRGRLGTSSDDVEPDAHNVTFTAVDYTSVLDRRALTNAIAPWTFTNIPQGSIVRQLISWTQGTTGGQLDISAGVATVPTTAINRTITFPVAKAIGEAIDELSVLENGFEWTVDEQLFARLWHPTRGGTRDLVLEYGSTVAKVGRTFDSADYANAILATGADGVVAQAALAGDLATRPEGRIDYVENLPDITSTSILLARANAALAARSVVNPTYRCTMFPGRWSPGELWLGDTTFLVVRSGRLNVSSFQRVTEIQVAVDDAGVETVDLILGKPPVGVVRRLVGLERRLKRVERLGAI